MSEDKTWALLFLVSLTAHRCCTINVWWMELTKMSDSNFIYVKSGRKWHQPGGRFGETVRWLLPPGGPQPLRYPRIIWGSYYLPSSRLTSKVLLSNWSETQKNRRWFCCRWPTDHIWGNADFELYICKGIKRMILLNVFSLAVLSAKFLSFLWEHPPTGNGRGYIFWKSFK